MGTRPTFAQEAIEILVERRPQSSHDAGKTLHQRFAKVPPYQPTIGEQAPEALAPQVLRIAVSKPLTVEPRVCVLTRFREAIAQRQVCPDSFKQILHAVPRTASNRQCR